MGTIRLTSKRQATLPRELCEEMHIGPGDLILVEKVEHDGQSVWCLRPSRPETPPWFGEVVPPVVETHPPLALEEFIN